MLPVNGDDKLGELAAAGGGDLRRSPGIGRLLVVQVAHTSDRRGIRLALRPRDREGHWCRLDSRRVRLRRLNDRQYESVPTFRADGLNRGRAETRFGGDEVEHRANSADARVA